jgi:acetyltransferase-like isoleucine patch superfamily enzyme
MSKTLYQINIENRSLLRYQIGKLARLKKHLYYSYARYVARKKGATIGDNVVLPLSLANRANANLVIGNNSSIQTDLIDMRAKVIIGDNVIIGSGVEIITCSHEIDSLEWEFKPYGIEIDDYAWIATRAFILPSCRRIGRGAVCGAGSLIVKDIEELSVMSGNPATPIKFRKQVHANLVVESLLGGDYKIYVNTWNKRR